MRFRPIVRVRVLQPDIAAGPTEAASELKWRTQKKRCDIKPIA